MLRPREPTPLRPITEQIAEANYFFKLSDYQQPLIQLIESGELHIQPETARNGRLSFLRGPVQQVQRGDDVRLTRFEGDG